MAAKIIILVLAIFLLIAVCAILFLLRKNEINATARKRNARILRHFMKEMTTNRLTEMTEDLRQKFQDIQRCKVQEKELRDDLKEIDENIDFYNRIANIVDKEIGKRENGQ